MGKESTYPINEISTTNDTFPEWYAIHNSKPHNTVDCRSCIQRSKPQIKNFYLSDNHLAKDCSIQKKASRDPSPDLKKTLTCTPYLSQMPISH